MAQLTPDPKPEEKVSEPTVTQEWIDDAAQRYLTNHQGMFTDLTLEIAKQTMQECAIEFSDLQYCENIIEKRYWLGMSRNWAKMSVGSPDDINTTVIKGLERQQWVYGNPIYGATYLYFDNDVLTSYQD